MKAIFFGSIGSIVETSEVQRKSFNTAFAEAGLNWHWDQASYREMLRTSGGRARIADFAALRGDAVNAAALHQRKSELFQQALAEGTLPLRSGIAATMADAKGAGLSLGFVTATERATVEIIARSVTATIGIDFDVLTWRADDLPGKPDPAVYRVALEQLNLHPADVIAIEDNRDGVLAAKAAGIFTIGFPGENTLRQDMDRADQIADPLDQVVKRRVATRSEAAA